MTIRITRNAAGNCLNFIGSSMPAYFNACLSGQVDGDDGDRVNVINDVQTANDPNGQFRYEFYQIPYTEFADKDGNSFSSAQEAADYITQEGNVLGVSDVGTSLNGITVNFRLDQTNTSIIMDNGAAFGVNTIKAVADEDGTIHIHAIGAGVPASSNQPDDHKHFEGLEANAVQINGVAVPGGINDVVNALNELFTVGPFEAVVITDPYSTMIADVNGIPAGYTLEGSTAIDPAGNDLFGNQASGNYAGMKSTATIDQAGEYFTFDIRVEGQIGFGLVHSDASFAAGKYQGSATYADPSTFAVGNSAHYGYQFSHWFHPTPNGSWTNYGASTGYVGGPGWSNWDQKQDWLDGNPVKIRVGINENGFIAISSLQDDGTWVLHARSSYPVPEGSEFHLGIKAAYPEPRVFSAPQVHLREPAAPVMQFRYIESPDGLYDFPLFATAEEANYWNLKKGGQGVSHVHFYADDPTASAWYMPDQYNEMNSATNPATANTDATNFFDGNPITWTEITSLTNADLAPRPFTGSLTVDEGASVNYQTQPQDTTYTTTITGLPLGLTNPGGGMIFGTAPEVSGDTVSNPSDTYEITVTRTNNYGSSQGTLNLTVNNLTLPIVTPISGFSYVAGSTPLATDDRLADGSVVELDDLLEVGQRLHVDETFLTNQVLPALITPDDGNPLAAVEKVFIGVPKDTADFTNGPHASDFLVGIMFQRQSGSSVRARLITDGTFRTSTGLGTTTQLGFEPVIQNYGDNLEIGFAYKTLNPENKPSSTIEGDWSNAQIQAGVTPASQKIVIGVDNGELEIATTGLNEIANPYLANEIRVIESSETAVLFDAGNGAATADNLTLTAGETYRFYLNDASIEAGDVLTFETADGSAYGTGQTVVGSHGDHYYYIEFAVPTDVPPLHPVWNGTDQAALQIAGSTYVAQVSGISIEGPLDNFQGNVIKTATNGWLSLTGALTPGERLVMDSAFIQDLNDALPDHCIFWVGLKANGWDNTAFPTDSFFGRTALRFYKTGGSEPGLRMMGYAEGGTSSQVYSASLASSSAFLEITGTGNNIRVGYYNSSAVDAATTTFADWDGNTKIQTGDRGYGVTSLEVMLYWQALGSNRAGFDISQVDWQGLSQISIPQPVAPITTPWNKALDFSGASERAQMVSTSSSHNPLMMGNVGTTVGGPLSSVDTSNDTNSRPWATAVVFQSDNIASNQHIWNVGEGSGSNDDNIYLRVASDRKLYFGWGRQGALNECLITTLAAQQGIWYGIYIAHNGTRLSGANATAANLAAAFDIRVVNLANGSVSPKLTSGNWDLGATGGRMDRTFTGATTIGGRGSNRSFRGKIASFVVTTLKLGEAMPSNAEITMMVRDPQQWLTDYKVGQTYRLPQGTSEFGPFVRNASGPAYGTQVWLMGDGQSDGYAQIRNNVYPSIQNVYPLNMISMVSNDIQTVNIPGLS